LCAGPFGRTRGGRDIPTARIKVPDARQNGLLAALPAEDYERLLPHLKLVDLPLGLTIHLASEPESGLFFITEGIVTKYYVTENGASAAFAVTGNEGVIGVALVLGAGRTPSQATVTSPGHALRLESSALKEELSRSNALQALLLRFVQALMAQIGQTAVCNRHHVMKQRLCHWILACLDRLPSNELRMTQELIAAMLGVRRESVTEAAQHLHMDGLISYSRGCIVVHDRPRLEAQACECYSVVHREYARILSPALNGGNRSTSTNWLGNT
jgi:CRP-like cAMP-binding protein